MKVPYDLNSTIEYHTNLWLEIDASVFMFFFVAPHFENSHKTPASKYYVDLLTFLNIENHIHIVN